MSTTDPAKRVPKSLGTDAKLFGRYTLADVAVGLGPAVLVVLTFQVIVPRAFAVRGIQVQSFTLPLAGGAVVLGALFVYLTPTYTSSLSWLGTVLRFHWSDKELAHEAAAVHTKVERVHPVEGAIERTDGAFVGMVKVEPPSLALATDAEWRRVATGFADFCNTAVEFPVQFYSTPQAFPVEEYLDVFFDRLGDPDVKANPRLAALIEGYVEWYAADLEDRRMAVRDHYVVVTVEPTEVHFERESLLQQLARLPGLGVLVEARFAPRRAEQRAAMVEALDVRLRRVETGLRAIDGCHASRVAVEDATRLVAEFWSGESLEFGEMSAVLRTRPVIGGPG